jgi:DAK2 domain fusion protein YloV
VVHVGPHSGRLKRLDAPAARRWAIATRAAFADRRAEIDDLNVFPVPDGDTGTNLYITLDSALEAVRELPEPPPASGPTVGGTLAADAATLSKAILLAARGSSGVIFSQLVRGLSEVSAETATSAGQAPGGSDGLDGATLAQALRRASDRAYASVTRPVEGTILSVAEAAATAAELAAADGADLYCVSVAALAAARVALAATTAQLPVLASAGVVDAGGLGYVLVLEALELVIAGERVREQTESPVAAASLSTSTMRVAAHGGDGGWAGPRPPGAPAYEVMYLLRDSEEEKVARLRARLDELGDSVLVVGGPDVWNVHVHVDDVGPAIQAGIEAGRPYRIAVTHFGDQQRARTAQPPRSPVAVVAYAPGQGLAEVFSQAGAMALFNGPGRRPSAGQLLDAIQSAGSRSVIVLPNEKDILLAADAAASAAASAGLDVHVVRSRSAVQGVAALAVFDPAASTGDNLIAMNGAATATSHGAVKIASKDSSTRAGWCQRGDVVGVVNAQIVVIGKDLVTVGAQVAARLLVAGGELLTLITGVGAGPQLGELVALSAREGHRNVEVAIIEGGQTTYPLLLGVE